MVNGYVCFKGETLDFVLTASQSQGVFDMTVSSQGHCKDSNLTHMLNIHYNSTLNDIISERKNPPKKTVSTTENIKIDSNNNKINTRLISEY